jgi:hypothetical protein
MVYLKETTVFVDLLLVEFIAATLRVLLVEDDGVSPARSQIIDPELMTAVELGEFLGECLNGREHELERHFHDGIFRVLASGPFKLLHLSLS